MRARETPAVKRTPLHSAAHLFAQRASYTDPNVPRPSTPMTSKSRDRSAETVGASASIKVMLDIRAAGRGAKEKWRPT